MLIALRATLLTLFIAAPFGERGPEADLQRVAEEYAPDAVLTCPVTPGLTLEVDTWSADEEHATVRPDRSGENA